MSDRFKEILSKSIARNLPGIFAQQKMAPTVRFIGRGFPEESSNAIKSAVLILLYPDSDFYGTVFIERNKYPGAHSGQISFPGGKFEKEDKSLNATAIRESEEEIGLNPSDITIIGSLTNLYIPVSNFLITPYVAYIDKKPGFQPDPKEVNSIIEINLNNLFAASNMRSKIFEKNNYSIFAPYYEAKGHHIWGATAMILSELKDVIIQSGLHSFESH